MSALFAFREHDRRFAAFNKARVDCEVGELAEPTPADHAGALELALEDVEDSRLRGQAARFLPRLAGADLGGDSFLLLVPLMKS